ncbi:VCBS repeat-containing protein [Verrucomicrobiaceae bacterium N1E253]|uniref:VCBS repeat-containing protein n=1 Tax=Oceaniferula marina TaxID=2748318 RepID=A0A851GR20_9BACT|nr:FG-GAP-like repeat-containing protein [Oceaniferula marina]NWK57565.1 VCBS repeat-containing protein [Oceaniferula marina]
MDLNGDGIHDILTGSYARMDGGPWQGLFYVFWGKKGGGFAQSVPLEGTDGEVLAIAHENGDAICTRPFAVDWDKDGDLDLIVGGSEGGLYLFTGEGQGRFAPGSKQIMAGAKPLVVPGKHADPQMVDWDGDGDLDILSGSNNAGIHWAENVAEDGDLPAFKGFNTLISLKGGDKTSTYLAHKIKGPTMTTRVWASDRNGDGKLDLTVGDYARILKPKPGQTTEDLDEAYAAWTTRQAEMLREVRMKEGKEEKRAAYDAYKAHKKIQDDLGLMSRIGRVWVYIQQ